LDDSTLPEACDVLSSKTLEDLVPEARKSGKEGSSDDLESRASCSWDSLDNNGVKGSQFRWLNVSLLRFDSDVSRGAGDELAREYYEGQIDDARAVTGARNTKSSSVAGIGDEATAVRYDLKKKEGSFRQQTVVARVENVVVTVDYNGAGLAGDKTPDADDLLKDAQKAAKEAVAAVMEANEPGGGKAKVPGSSPSASKASGGSGADPSGTKSPSRAGSSSKSSSRKS
jgi:DNA-binding protein YbaB